MKESESGLKIEYLEEAIDDLENLIDYYIGIFGMDSAKKVYGQIMKSIDRLRVFPDSGRPSKDKILRSLEYRECYSGRFVVIYRVDYQREKVIIYHIADMQRDYPNLYKDDKLS